MQTVSAKRPTAAPADADQLRAILDLTRAGYTRDEVMRVLKISRATYYRRLGEIRRRAETAGPEPDEP